MKFIIFVLGVLVLLTSCGGRVPAASWYGTAADQDHVLLAANEQILALDPESGAELWAFPPERDPETGTFYAAPLVHGQLVIVGSFDPQGKLYALSVQDGSQQWVVETKGQIIESPVIANGDIIVGTDEGDVFAIAVETHQERLLFKAQAAIWAAPLVDPTANRLYVASMDHRLYALDLTTGETLWQFDAGGAIAGTPALSDDTLYLGSLNNTFYAVRADTGEQIWHIQTDGWVWGGPVVQDDTVYVGDLSGTLYALDTADGSPRWTFQADGGIRATPLLSDDTLYIGTRSNTVYALDAYEGTIKWELPITGSILGQPILHQGRLFISPHNAKIKLLALNPESGAKLWEYPSQEE